MKYIPKSSDPQFQSKRDLSSLAASTLIEAIVDRRLEAMICMVSK